MTELPAELGDLPHLRRLYLGMARRTDDDGAADWYGRGVSGRVLDLAPLTGLSGLQRLNLWLRAR
jgi:hypothetical protein